MYQMGGTHVLTPRTCRALERVPPFGCPRPLFLVDHNPTSWRADTCEMISTARKLCNVPKHEGTNVPGGLKCPDGAQYALPLVVGLCLLRRIKTTRVTTQYLVTTRKQGWWREKRI